MLSVDPLSHDVLFKIFEFLEVCDLINCELVCQRWRQVLLSNHLWRKSLQRKVKYAFLRNDWFASFALFVDCFLDENRLKTVLDGKK
jgi:hypothetical protein